MRTRYFKAAFTGEFRESEDAIITMEEDSQIVHYLLQYIYDMPSRFSSDNHQVCFDFTTRLQSLTNVESLRLLEASDKYLLPKLFDMITEDVLEPKARQAYKEGLSQFHNMISELGIEQHPLRDRLVHVFSDVMEIKPFLAPDTPIKTLIESFPWLIKSFMDKGFNTGWLVLRSDVPFVVLCRRCAEELEMPEEANTLWGSSDVDDGCAICYGWHLQNCSMGPFSEDLRLHMVLQGIESVDLTVEESSLE